MSAIGPAPAATSAQHLPPLAKLRLGGEILVAYGRVRWAMWRYELPRTVATLRRARAAPAAPLPDGARDGVRLGAAVIRTISLLPSDSRCLMRSLVLLRLLARRRTECELVIAVARPETLPNGELGLGAHAWIERDGQPLLPPAAPGFARLLSL